MIGTLFLELGFTFLVWNRRTRWFMVSCSVLFHTMIALLMGLVTFSLMMLALVLAFVPPEVVRQCLLIVERASQAFAAGSGQTRRGRIDWGVIAMSLGIRWLTRRRQPVWQPRRSRLTRGRSPL